MGTWKLAVVPLDNPRNIYFVKNSGEFILGKSVKSIIVSSSEALFDESAIEGLQIEKIPNNYLVDLKDDCTFTMEKLEKKIIVDRLPKAGFDHIFQEEIYESADAVNAAIDFGQKFLTNHQVYLGGFDHAQEELKLIQDLIISAKGTSKIAAEYGSYIMKQLRCFNTVKVFDANEIRKTDLQKLGPQGGYLTLSQSGESQVLLQALKWAKEAELTCINVVNAEDSPITKQISSEDEHTIGLYMKAGYCYCDIKSFIPQVVCLSLVALWFSDHKNKKPNSNILLINLFRGS